jgi:peptidyl-prolyl cis-trans isomerase SurA
VEKGFKIQTGGQDLKGEQATSLRLSVLNDLIQKEILLQRAQKLGLLATDEEVDSKITEFKAPYTQEEFDRRLKEQGMTLDDLKREVRRNLTIQKVLNKEITSKITISDADISAYYNEHKAEFNLVEPQYQVSQIVVSAQPNPQAPPDKRVLNEGDARKKIQAIANRLESGEDFATVASRYSDDPNTASNGGDMGAIPESAIKRDPSAWEQISKLRPGQISGVVPVVDPTTKKAAGFRVFKLSSKEPAGQREISDPRVQQFIREQLRSRREQLLKAAYYETLRDEAKVNNYFADNILKNSGR